MNATAEPKGLFHSLGWAALAPQRNGDLWLIEILVISDYLTDGIETTA